MPISDDDYAVWLLAHRSVIRAHRRNNREVNYSASRVKNVSARRNRTMTKPENLFVSAGVGTSLIGQVWAWMTAHASDASTAAIWIGLFVAVVGLLFKIAGWGKTVIGLFKGKHPSDDINHIE